MAHQFVSTGGVAQLVEHCVCNAKVTGSKPVASTILLNRGVADETDVETQFIEN